MFPNFKEQITIGDLQLNFVLDGDDTDSTLVVFEMIVPPNAKVPAPHYHVDVDETLYIMEGTFTQIYGSQTLELKKATSCLLNAVLYTVLTTKAAKR